MYVLIYCIGVSLSDLTERPTKTCWKYLHRAVFLKIRIIWGNIQNTMKEFYDWLLKYALSSWGLDFGTHVIYMLYVCVLVPQLVQLCSMDCSPPGSSVHGIFQARILEWVAIPFSREFPLPMDWTWISCIALGSFTIWATFFLNFMRNPVWHRHSIKLLPSLIEYNKFPELSHWLLTLH